MEDINMRLPKLDSATFRAIVTALQTLVGFVAVLFVMPEFRSLVEQFYPQALPLVVAAAGIASFILNFFRKDVKNY